jgi:hypothetical protein
VKKGSHAVKQRMRLLPVSCFLCGWRFRAVENVLAEEPLCGSTPCGSAPLRKRPLRKRPPSEAPPAKAPPCGSAPCGSPPCGSDPCGSAPCESAPLRKRPPAEAPPCGPPPPSEAPPAEPPPAESPPAESPPAEAPLQKLPLRNPPLAGLMDAASDYRSEDCGFESRTVWWRLGKMITAKIQVSAVRTGFVTQYILRATVAIVFLYCFCRDPGSNRGPSDLQSDALPTELSRLGVCKKMEH